MLSLLNFAGDRHPKVGEHVLIGAGSMLLGNITVGNSAKIGAGSVLLRDIPSFATAVGVPAKIVGRTDESDPADDVDNLLHRVSLLGRKPSTVTTADSTRSSSSITEEISSIDSGSNYDDQNGTDHEELGKHEKTPRSFRVIKCKELQEPPRSAEGDKFCPFIEYAEVAQRGTPEGTVNIMTLANVLHEEGTPHCLVGLCFFEMDHKGRGYIAKNHFLKHGPEILSRNCGYSEEKSNALVQKALSLVEVG
jgi:hypothetical protein